MAHSKQAVKRLRQSKAAKVRNKSQKSAMKTSIKRLIVAIESDSADKAKILSSTIRKVDQVAAKGVIHKNKANRIKSRMTRKLNAASAAPKQ